ncbi:MAG: hypothetical protein WAW06_10220 [bacterium]
MKLWTCVLAAVALAGFHSACFGQEAYPTNIEMVERAVRAAVDSMKVAPVAGRPAYLEVDAGSGTEAAWLVDNVLTGRLIEEGWNVRAKGSEKDSALVAAPEYLLKLRVGELGLIYARSWRRHLFFGKAVERVARVSFFYDLVDRTDDSVVRASSARAEVRDVVPASALRALADSKYPFASPVLEKSQWDRYVEGALVLAIVGVLVYLFYSNKTA